jgi:hypothetical protein
MISFIGSRAAAIVYTIADAKDTTCRPLVRAAVKGRLYSERNEGRRTLPAALPCRCRQQSSVLAFIALKMPYRDVV